LHQGTLRESAGVGDHLRSAMFTRASTQGVVVGLSHHTPRDVENRWVGFDTHIPLFLSLPWQLFPPPQFVDVHTLPSPLHQARCSVHSSKINLAMGLMPRHGVSDMRYSSEH
jgi:hypothetical protein